MTVHLTAELQRRVLEKVESGHYDSATEVIREALQVLEERDQGLEAGATAFKAEIEGRLASGPPTPMDFAALKRRLREEVESRQLRRAVAAAARP